MKNFICGGEIPPRLSFLYGKQGFKTTMKGLSVVWHIYMNYKLNVQKRKLLKIAYLVAKETSLV